MLRQPLWATMPLLVYLLQQVSGQTIEDQQLYFMRLTPISIPGLLSDRPQALLNEFNYGSNDGIYLKERVMKSDTSFGLIEIAPPPSTNPYQDIPIPNVNTNGVSNANVNMDVDEDSAMNQRDIEEEYGETESVGTIYNDGGNVESNVYGEYWAFHRLSYKRDPTGRRFAVQFTSKHRVTDEGYNGLPSVWIAGNPTFVRGMGGELLFVQNDDGTVMLDAPPGDTWDVFACAITPNLSDPNINPLTVPALLWQILTVQRAVWTQVKYPGISDANPVCVAVSMTLEPVPQGQRAITSSPVIQDETVDTALGASPNGNAPTLGKLTNTGTVANPNDDDYDYDMTNGFSYDENELYNSIYGPDPNLGNVGLDAISEASSSLEDSVDDILVSGVRVDANGNVRPEQVENSQGPLYLPDGSEEQDPNSAPASFDANHPINPIQRFNSYTGDPRSSRNGVPEWGLGPLQRFYSAGDLKAGSPLGMFGQEAQPQDFDLAALGGAGNGVGGMEDDEVVEYVR
ncbi:hypothetical protein TWF696_002424 [Orbilia brochopaga]|uniref:Uncharacterized protein n=1 Tax=Orbilia brochopaga TaxID=3140254 RepID=A0AAV9U8I6_9PEZI